MHTTFLRHLGSLKVLFTALITLFVLIPFFEMYDFAQFIFVTGFSLVLLLTIYSVHIGGMSPYRTLAVGVGAIGVNIIATVYYSKEIELISMLVNLAFFTYAIVLLFHSVFQRVSVNINIVLGAVCIYLLSAINFGILYTIIDALVPNSFTGLVTHSATSLDTFFRNFLYYSLVTMTTLGYGDIMPVSPPARYFAALQSAFGQIYMGILVARLMGMHLLNKR